MGTGLNKQYQLEDEMEIRPKDNVILAMKHEEPYWIPNNITDCNIVLQQAVQERYEGHGSGTDEFGVQFIYDEESRGPAVKPGTRVFENIGDWHSLKFPDLENRDWEAIAAKDTANWDRQNKFSIVQMYNGMFERAHIMMGFQEVLMALIEEPDEMEGWFQAFTDYRCDLIKKIAQYYKPDAVMIFDDYGAKNSMMFSPNTWRELIKPQLKRMIDTAHECGMYYILHGDGFYRPIFPDIVELGADAVHPVQTCNNPKELKCQYGKQICFCGAFDNVDILDVDTCTEQQTRDEVRRVLTEIAPGGSYIAWRSFLIRHPEIFMDEYWKIVSIQKEKALAKAALIH